MCGGVHVCLNIPSVQGNPTLLDASLLHKHPQALAATHVEVGVPMVGLRLGPVHPAGRVAAGAQAGGPVVRHQHLGGGEVQEGGGGGCLFLGLEGRRAGAGHGAAAQPALPDPLKRHQTHLAVALLSSQRLIQQLLRALAVAPNAIVLGVEICDGGTRAAPRPGEKTGLGRLGMVCDAWGRDAPISCTAPAPAPRAADHSRQVQRQFSGGRHCRNNMPACIMGAHTATAATLVFTHPPRHSTACPLLRRGVHPAV